MTWQLEKLTVSRVARFFSNAWDLTLRRGGQGGEVVCHITKSGWSSEKLITMPNGWNCPLVHTGMFSSSHEFVGFDGTTRYKWKSGTFSSDWTLYRSGDKQVVATWRTSSFSISKDGQLLINAVSEVPPPASVISNCIRVEPTDLSAPVLLSSVHRPFPPLLHCLPGIQTGSRVDSRHCSSHRRYVFLVFPFVSRH